MTRCLKPSRMARAWLVLSVAGLLSACGGSSEPTRYPVRVRALDEYGEPLPGLALAGDGRELGATDASGTLELALPGVEGENVELRPRCPEGYRDAQGPSSLSLKRLMSLQQGQLATAEVTFTCQANEHSLVVVIRTGEPAIPVRLLEEEVARTGELGTTHVVRKGRPGTSFKLTLDTADDSELQPFSPARLFIIAEQDAFVIWEQPLQRVKAKRPPKRKVKPPPKPEGPYRLSGES